MQVTIGTVKKPTSGRSNESMISSAYRKGYSIPLLPHQTGGILSRVLWPSKNQILRIVPGYDTETGEVYRQNINVAEYSEDAPYTNFLSDTFCISTVVSRFGSITVPFISDYEPGSPDAQKWGRNTVLHNFIRSITYACSEKGSKRKLIPTNEWKQWAGIGPSSTLALDKPALLMQALVFHINSQNNQDADKNDLVDENGEILPLLAVVAVDNKTSISNLTQALTTPKDRGMNLDAYNNSSLGPMAELDGTKLFLNTYTDPTTGFAALRPSVQLPGKGWTPTPYPLDESDVKALWIPWDKLLHYMTLEEQLRLCAAEYGADTVNYVFANSRDFRELVIPDDIKRAGLGRYASMSQQGPVTVDVPAAPAPQAATIGRGLGSRLGAPKPAMPASNTDDLPVSSTLDMSKLRDTVAKMHGGVPAAAVDQAGEAQDLLDD